MQDKNIQIPQGRALLICGPQGSGKTQLAMTIAQQYGPFQETYADVIQQRDSIDRAMRAGIKTLIVDECPAEFICAGLPPYLKSLITDKQVPFKADGKAVTLETPPRFIFCSSGIERFDLFRLDRRFFVIDMTAIKH